MLQKSAFTLLLLLLCGFHINAQPKLSGDIALLVSPEGVSASRAKWSPSSNSLLFTGLNQTGIYVYNIQTNSVEPINNDPAIGFGASWVNNESILVRHTIKDDKVSKHAVAFLSISGDLNLVTDYIHTMPALPLLSANQSSIYYLDRTSLKTASSGLIQKSSSLNQLDIIPIGKSFFKMGENNKVVPQLLSTFTFDSDIINVVYSTDRSKIAFEVLGGNLMVIDVLTNSIYDLGKANRPSFSPDGNYVVAMVAEDDGYEITSSDVIAFRYDGSQQVNLTSTFSRRALNPDWSPKGDKIVFDSPDTGALYIIPIEF